MVADTRLHRRTHFAAAVAVLCSTVLIACGSGPSLSDDLRTGLGDDLADCLEENLDGDVIEALNEEGIELDVMTEATADAYGAALTVCEESSG